MFRVRPDRVGAAQQRAVCSVFRTCCVNLLQIEFVAVDCQTRRGDRYKRHCPSNDLLQGSTLLVVLSVMLITTALVALSALVSVHAQTTYDAQSLAAQLNLTNSFNYTFPAATSLKQYANTSSNAKSAYTRGNNATFNFMRSNWNLYRDFIQFGRSDLGFVADPEPKSSSSGNTTLAFAVQYPAGSYSHATGGAQFYSAFPGTTNSSGISPLAMLLTYSVYFPANYSFVHGGKLAGLRGGDVNGCAGGEKTNGTSCFSSRLMWRDGGAGEGLSLLL
jgi:hypothetical protein